MIRPSKRSGCTTEKYSLEARLTSTFAPGDADDALVQLIGDVVAPIRVEVSTVAVVDLRTHLEPVWLDQVEWAQHAV